MPATRSFVSARRVKAWRYLALALLVGLVAQLFALSSASARTDSRSVPAFRDGTVLVGFKAGTTRSQRLAAGRAVGASELRVIGAGTHVLRVPDGKVLSTISRLKRNPRVRYAEPNHLLHAFALPNDPYFKNLWGLRNSGQDAGGWSGTPGSDIAAHAAWDVTTGSKNVVVGVVDTGVYYAHADLAANMWSNPGINGCPAGTRGWDAVYNDCDPNDDNDHGTHVSGTIGAVGNNKTGVAGVNWISNIMALKFLDATGNGTTENAIRAIDWAINAKIAGVNLRVLNNSWGGDPYNQALLDVIKKAGANDILFVAAAGNGGEDGRADDNDAAAVYPCNYGTASAENPEPATNVICVAASDNNDNLTTFSNYGATSVDLAAPGHYIHSTIRYGLYRDKSGTSMAAPHVVGGAALILAVNPDLTVAELKARIVGSVDLIPSMSGKLKSGGRFDVCKAIPGCIDPPPPSDFTLTATPDSRTVVRGASATYTITVTPRNGFTGTVTLSTGGLPAKTTASFSPNPVVPPNTSSTLTIKTTTSARKSSYIITVIGVSGEHTRKITIRLTLT